jgi:ribosomal protein S18 acetylase RimI-like enzyme
LEFSYLEQGSPIMDTIQTDVSDEALVRATRANMCDFFRHMSRSNPAEHFENKQFTRWYTPLPHPWFNGVLCSAPPNDGDEAFIAETIRYFRGNGVPTFTWWMEPHLKPSDWEPVLSRHGFGFSNDTPGMAIDLLELNESLQRAADLDIRIAGDAESMRTWIKVFTKGYGLPPAWESTAFDLWMQLGLDLPIHNYLGYLNGRPVSTSTVFYGGGAAGIYCVSTLPEARGRGIGAAITLRPLQAAREMGYRVGVLQSSEMGFHIYKNLGFRHLCQIENFYLSL